jgi:FkbM family methyltransferase
MMTVCRLLKKLLRISVPYPAKAWLEPEPKVRTVPPRTMPRCKHAKPVREGWPKNAHSSTISAVLVVLMNAVTLPGLVRFLNAMPFMVTSPVPDLWAASANVRGVTFLHIARQFVQSRGIDVTRFPGDHPTHRVVQLLRHHGVTRVLDVGANDGGYATELRRFGYTGRMVSFEPLTAPFHVLRGRASGDPGWVTLPYAIGAEPGPVTINVAANDGASSSVLPMLAAHEDAAPGAKVVGAETVTQHPLDDLWPEVTAPDDLVFLKVDVQGYERQVLDGVVGHLDRIVGLQLELSMVPLYEGGWRYDEALVWARQQGFTLMRLIPGFTDQGTGQMLQADGVFFRN